MGRVTENVGLLPSALRLEESQAVLSKDQEQRKRGQEGPEGAGRDRGGPGSGPAAPGAAAQRCRHRRRAVGTLTPWRCRGESGTRRPQIW